MALGRLLEALGGGGAGSGIGGGGDLSARGRLTIERSDARLERRWKRRGGARVEETGAGAGTGTEAWIGAKEGREREGRLGFEDVRAGLSEEVSSSGALSVDMAGPASGEERSGFRMRLTLWRRLRGGGDIGPLPLVGSTSLAKSRF